MTSKWKQYYFRFYVCWYRCLQKVKVYEQTKFRRHNYVNWWLRCNYLRFEKQTSAILEIYFGFDFDHLPEIWTLFCIRLPNFVQIEAPTVEIWRHIHFSRWRPRPLNTTSGLVSVDVTAFKVYQQTKFRRDISIGDWDITTSGFEIQTSAILEFYSRPFRRNRPVILHPAAEFHPNRNIRRWNMTSYRFSMLYLLWGNGGPPTK